MIDYLILYEHKARELDSVCLIKAALELRGYSVKIEKTAKFSYAEYRKKANRPKVILTYSLYNNDSISVQVLSVAGRKTKKVINLHWEEIIGEDPETIRSHTPQGNAKEGVHICWGPKPYQRLIDHGIKKAYITGGIHLDLLNPFFSDYYLSTDELRNKYNIPNKKILLYLSSFTQTDLNEKEISILVQEMGNSVLEFFKVANKTKEITIEWLQKFLKENDDYVVVYRPHPGENIDKALKSAVSDNFFIISEESARQWIVRSDITTTWVSTAVTEVYYAKKKCIILRPLEVDKSQDITIFENCRSVNTYESFIDEVKNEYDFPIDINNIKRYYANGGPKFAYENIVDLAINVINNPEYDIPKYGFKNILHGVIFRFKRFVKKWIIKLHIKSTTFPVCLFKRTRNWVNFLYHYVEKEKTEEVSEELINEKVTFFKKLIANKQNDK